MPVCLALLDDSFPLAVRQLAISPYIGVTLVGQLVRASAGGLVAEWLGWRGTLGCAAVLGVIAAAAILVMMPKSVTRAPTSFSFIEAVARYRLVLSKPRSFVCFGGRVPSRCCPL